MIRVLGETCLICLTKFASSSIVLIVATPFVLSTSKIWGSLRVTKSPNLLGGPGGKGVACGVGVGGTGVSVAGILGGVGVIVGSGIKTDACAEPSLAIQGRRDS